MSLTQRKIRSAHPSPAESGCVETKPEPELNAYLAGEVIADRYRLDREIGRGGMGVVWVAHSLVLGVDVAVKLIRAERAGAALATRMGREAHAAARLGHPALVRVFDFGWTNRGDPFLVMELVTGETLSAKLEREGPMPAIRAVQAILPIADGLRLAHDRSIVHRDIKPDNILLAADSLGRIQPKLLDFGIAKVGHTPSDGKLTQAGAVLGSPEYMSPEQARGLDSVDERTDVWSLSVALYELMTGVVPFTGANYNALMQAIIHEPVKPLTAHGAGDAGLWEVLEHGLRKEPNERWASMTELGEALALWLYEHGVKEDLSGNSIRAVWLDRPLSLTPGANFVAAVPPSAPGFARSAATVVAASQRLGLRSRRSWVAAAIFACVALGTFATMDGLFGGPSAASPSPIGAAEGGTVSGTPRLEAARGGDAVRDEAVQNEAVQNEAVQNDTVQNEAVGGETEHATTPGSSQVPPQSAAARPVSTQGVAVNPGGVKAAKSRPAFRKAKTKEKKRDFGF